MSESTVAGRYAEALIDVAAEAGKTELIAGDLATLEQVFEANEGELGRFVASPVFSVDERASVLDAVLAKLDLDPFSVNLIKVLNSNGRLAVFEHLRERYDALADDRAGRVRVQVTTAEALTPALEAEIKASLEKTTGKTVLVEHRIDPSLIGGMIARVGGTVYDSSLRTRLSQLKHALTVAEA